MSARRRGKPTNRKKMSDKKTELFQKAQSALEMLEQPTVELLRLHPNGLTNREVTAELGLESDQDTFARTAVSLVQRERQSHIENDHCEGAGHRTHGGRKTLTAGWMALYPRTIRLRNAPMPHGAGDMGDMDL